ncbi:MAG: TIGR04086 family membrane protein [Oscillospiraceae bacterium]|nr:TIGR04086 family membrane protein [Oscillospiraceae bacterium]
MKATLNLPKSGTAILLFGAGAAITTVLASMLCAALILREILPEDRLKIYSAVICAISVLLACLIAGSRQEKATAAVPMGVAAVYFAIILLAKAFAFPGAADGIPARAGIIAGAAILASLLLNLAQRGRGARRRKKYR